LSKRLKDIQPQLDHLDNAKLNVALAYTLNTLYFSTPDVCVT
jgi:hypothetical protein